MDHRTFSRLEAESKRLVGSSGATAQGLKRAFAKLNTKLSPEDKVSALLHFVRRGRKTRDWLAWYFVHGAIPGAQKLPWTTASLAVVLDGVAADCQVLPPELVARAAEQLVKAQGLDAPTRKRVLAAAKSMWPPGSSEGSNFKKAAAKLRALAARAGGGATKAQGSVPRPPRGEEAVPNPEAQLRSYLGRLDPKIQKLARAVRAAMRKRFPAANELAYDYRSFAVIAYSPTERGIDAIVAIAARPTGVFLYFKQAPRRGKQTHFIRVGAVKELSGADVKGWIAAALAQSKHPLPRKGKGRLIDMSAKKRRRA